LEDENSMASRGGGGVSPRNAGAGGGTGAGLPRSESNKADETKKRAGRSGGGAGILGFSLNENLVDFRKKGALDTIMSNSKNVLYMVQMEAWVFITSHS
jgi:hypothetical protein